MNRYCISGEKDVVASMLISHALKAQKDGPVFFIDAGGCFQKHFLKHSYLRKFPRSLENIKVAYPATVYELKASVAFLHDTADASAHTTIILSPPGDLFSDEPEMEGIWKDIIAEVIGVSDKMKCSLIIGHNPGMKKEEVSLPVYEV
ncbi:hypothetical protein J4460_08005 [Candidatus Woesearchaeota archaeon]|nr:hypothetical protein [Candidatus Woesearchaeota archaeon]HIH38315.1 hypothetical protein [Candidatus Woesearchaeota archaeon]HIH48453.1 hypothetical protein [Candidatus Woesearchaeota archaeon]HIJ03293.1 hypothetical protein [Candidatus Woesearchaeota archaeon]